MNSFLSLKMHCLTATILIPLVWLVIKCPSIIYSVTLTIRLLRLLARLCDNTILPFSKHPKPMFKNNFWSALNLFFQFSFCKE